VISVPECRQTLERLRTWISGVLSLLIVGVFAIPVVYVVSSWIPEQVRERHVPWPTLAVYGLFIVFVLTMATLESPLKTHPRAARKTWGWMLAIVVGLNFIGVVGRLDGRVTVRA
jgi:hypothetical protein